VIRLWSVIWPESRGELVSFEFTHMMAHGLVLLRGLVVAAPIKARRSAFVYPPNRVLMDAATCLRLTRRGYERINWFLTFGAG
jgi:hypothetical protein